MHMEQSEKGWLRAYFPRATPDQTHDFIERVGIKLNHAGQTGEDVNKARLEVFNEMMGTVA